MAVTVDYYKELELDRSWDEKTIREKLKDLQKVWTKRQSACNDKEQLLIIDKIQEMIENAFRFLTKLDIENPIIRINTAFKGCSSLEKISVLPRIYHN